LISPLSAPAAAFLATAIIGGTVSIAIIYSRLAICTFPFFIHLYNPFIERVHISFYEICP